jgi:hypothetical protein
MVLSVLLSVAVAGWCWAGMRSSRLAAVVLVTLPVVALARIASLTCSGVKAGWVARTAAAAPETSGAA